MLPADLYALGLDLRRAALRRRRRHHVAVVAWAAAVALGAGAGVVAATSLLGSPAPGSVQTDLHRAVKFALAEHPGLRLQTATVVATSSAATLYSIADKRGNYCAELVGRSHGLIFGFTCESTSVAENGQLIVAGDAAAGVSYLVAPDGTAPPVVIFGRLPPHSVAARATYDNGAHENVPVGLDRFFIYQPSARLQAFARRMPVTLEFFDGRGAIWSYYLQPPQPLRLRGEHHISGRVVIDRATNVELDVAPWPGAAPDRVIVPLHADGTFSWIGRPRSVVYRLTVRDQHGDPVSADTGVLTAQLVSGMAALSK